MGKASPAALPSSSRATDPAFAATHVHPHPCSRKSSSASATSRSLSPRPINRNPGDPTDEKTVLLHHHRGPREDKAPTRRQAISRTIQHVYHCSPTLERVSIAPEFRGGPTRPMLEHTRGNEGIRERPAISDPDGAPGLQGGDHSPETQPCPLGPPEFPCHRRARPPKVGACTRRTDGTVRCRRTGTMQVGSCIPT
jgi:hypothetical protein